MLIFFFWHGVCASWAYTIEIRNAMHDRSIQFNAEIVLIDEDVGFGSCLKFLLKEHGIKVEHSADFFDILVLLKETTDVLMIDTDLLHREGFHHLDNIRKHFPSTKVILTASGSRTLGNVCGIRRGAVACLLKFFPQDRWLRVVQQALC